MAEAASSMTHADVENAKMPKSRIQRATLMRCFLSSDPLRGLLMLMDSRSRWSKVCKTLRRIVP